MLLGTCSFLSETEPSSSKLSVVVTFVNCNDSSILTTE